jgi:DNA-binding SARP family transcriptional activator
MTVSSRLSDRPVAGSLRLALVGGFALSCGGEERRLPGSVQRLLAFLALQERPVPRQRAAFALWPDASEAHAYGSLRAAVFRLKSGCRDRLLRDGRELGLREDVEVDLHRARALAGEACDSGATELEAILRGGELLPDWYDDWVLIERERFHELRSRMLEELSGAYLRSGTAERAIEVALAAVQAEPLRESSRRALIRAQLAIGNRAEALAQYTRFSELLSAFGLTPSPELDSLVRGLVAQ